MKYCLITHDQSSPSEQVPGSNSEGWFEWWFSQYNDICEWSASYGKICSSEVGKQICSWQRRVDMVVDKLMYGYGALAWYQKECDDLEIRHNGMGR